MRTRTGMILTCGFFGAASLAASFSMAQRPGDGPGAAGPDDLVGRMMAFDQDKDGKLIRSEITDERLLRLFDRADADKDGTVTNAELTALATREAPSNRGGFQGGPGGRGGPGGPGGPRMGGGGRPGEVLGVMLQQRLRLTPEQRTQVEALQKDVDARLEKILTEEQRAQLKEMRGRGPGGPGGFGGPGGPPGGRPGGDGPPPSRPD
jgi:hypothetical protein